MPLIKSAKKKMKQDKKRMLENKKYELAYKKVFHQVKKHKKGVKPAELMKKAYQAIDKAMKTGIIKKNNAARKKARLAKMVKGK